jgi:hypothetical protein
MNGRHGVRNIELRSSVLEKRMCLWESILFPKPFELLDEKTDEGKLMLRIIDVDEMAFTELVLSIDINSTIDKIAFGIVKSTKPKIMKMVMLAYLGRS